MEKVLERYMSTTLFVKDNAFDFATKTLSHRCMCPIPFQYKNKKNGKSMDLVQRKKVVDESRRVGFANSINRNCVLNLLRTTTYLFIDNDDKIKWQCHNVYSKVYVQPTEVKDSVFERSGRKRANQDDYDGSRFYFGVLEHFLRERVNCSLYFTNLLLRGQYIFMSIINILGTNKK